jgi:hypothetical protein
MESNFSVNAFGSHPDLENDDCWYGEDCETFQQACDILAQFVAKKDRDTAYFVIDSYGFHYEVKNPFFRPSQRDGEWEQEIATQAGMMGGCDA